MNKFQNWSDELGKSWVKLDPDRAMSLFSKDSLEYYESVFTDPCVSWDEVYKLWEVIPNNQKNVKYWSEVISSDGNHAIIHWKVSRLFIPTDKNQEIDGIFEIRLDEKIFVLTLSNGDL